MQYRKLSMGLAAGAIALGSVAFVARPSIAQAFSNSAIAALVTPDGGFRGGPGGGGSLIEAAVTVTGLTRDEVFADLKAGQTLTQIAESKGKTAADVIAAARTELQTRLTQAVTDGKIIQTDADAKLKAFDDGASATMTSTTLGQMPQGGGPGFGHGDFGRGGGPGGLIEATVSVTGLTREEVMTDLQAGQTLTQIAESKGKTVADVIAAARTQLQTQLAQAVTDGKITQAESDAKLKAFDDGASATMTSTTLGQMPLGGGGPRGFGMGGGPQSLIEATVSVTGLTRDEVFTDLKAGQSLAQIAVSKGKTADAVIAAAKTQLQESLKQAVTDGKLTQAQADSALANFDKTATETVNSTTLGQGGPGMGGPGFEHGGPGGGGSLIESTATVTGLTREEVFTDLQAGQTLSQIAESKGKTADEVVAAARTELQTRLAQAVTDGKLTQADADAKLKSFDDGAAATMTSTTLSQMPQGGGHRGGPGGFGGFGPNGGQPPAGLPSGTAAPTGGSGA